MSNHTDWEQDLAYVLEDVTAERRRQVAKGWTPEHDAEHPLDTMLNLARHRVNLASGIAAAWPSPIRAGEARRRLIQAIAILVATVEAIDRREGTR